MRINGIELKTLTAGLGITGIVVGFALQDLLKDWIMGVSIIVDDYYGVGDIVNVDGIIGEVIKLSLKTTKIKDLAYGNIVSFNNRNIEKVFKVSSSIDVSMPIPYGMSVAESVSLVNEVVARMSTISGINNVKSVGVQEFGQAGIMELISAECNNISKRNQAMRDMRNVIRQVYDEKGIEIPHISALFQK